MNYLIVLFLMFSACQTKPSPTPAPSPSTTAVATLDVIKNFAATSACAVHSWGNGQGSAPTAYTQGMALAYAREVCKPNATVGMSFADVDESTRDETDAISWYNSNFTAAGLTSSPMARKVYTLLISEGMQESSGEYCTGADPNTRNPSDFNTIEAGMFQTSWNSHEVNAQATAALIPIWNAPTSNCLNDFKTGISCDASNLKNYGTGDTAKFQAREKDCPAFAVEYAAVAFRTERKEYEPLNDKTADIAPECDAMFAQVEKIIHENHALCGLL